MYVKLMIIEAPGKLKKLVPMLKKLRPGEHWHVVASGGHIRDLPAKGGEDADTITVGVRKNFTPIYEYLEKGGRSIKALRAAVKTADEIYLATDPDREGESIAWHIQQTLGLKQYKRIAFGDLTPSTVAKALENPRTIDLPRVASQECRRVLDRLVGYLVTQELRRVMGQPTTAGRVQTPALLLVVLREREIRAFQAVHHFGVRVQFQSDTGDCWFADWVTVPDFATKDTPHVQDESLAQAVANIRQLVVIECKDRKQKRSPPPPFISSTLQQAASNVLKWSLKKTMQVAQRLYEQAAISYHRTDNPNIPEDAMPQVIDALTALGLPSLQTPRIFATAEGAQEGHPAITPTEWGLEDAGENEDERALYRLVRVRALASQMEDAIYDVREAKLMGLLPDRRAVTFAARGRTVAYPGFLRLLADDTSGEDRKPDSNNPVPLLEPRQTLHPTTGELQSKRTEPPGRYTEASLVKELERRGIGRPGTFASIVDGIIQRGLVVVEKRKLHPGAIGDATIGRTEGVFSFIELDYTRELERDLDQIAQSKATFSSVVARLYSKLESELQTLRQLPSVPMEWSSSSSSTSLGAAAKDAPVYSCTKCGKPLMRRQKKAKGDDKGYDFWGCTGFKEGCKVSYPNLRGKPDFNKPRGM